MAGNLPTFAYTCIHDYGLFTGKGYGLKNQPEEEMHRTEAISDIHTHSYPMTPFPYKS